MFALNGRQILPKGEGDALYVSNFLDNIKAIEIFNSLITEVDWEERSIRLFGKEFLQPRLMAWYGDPGAIYSYSGDTYYPKKWSPTLSRIKEIVEYKTKTSFNSALVNFYRDGLDSMGAHSDDEPELGPQPVIASLSLGQTRRFRFLSREDKRRITINLEHGSLLLMRGETQNLWKHDLPKSKSLEAPRINITLRRIFP